MQIEARHEAMGLVLPAPVKVPPGVRTSFSWTRLHRDRVYTSGHGPLTADGTPMGPFGKVEQDVTLEQGYEASKQAALALLSSLKRAIGDLDRVTARLRIDGFVNALPGSIQTTNVVNGCSDLILELYGEEVGQHARTAIGAVTLPLNFPVVVAAEVAIAV